MTAIKVGSGCGLVAAMVLLWIFTIESLMLSIVSVILAWFLLAGIALSGEGGAVFRRVVVIFVCFVGILGLHWLHSAIYIMYREHFPPPRPMFHNEFLYHERMVLPGWYRMSSNVDSFGNWLFADFDDNTLLIIGSAEALRHDTISCDVHAFRVKVGNDRHVTIPRVQGKLIVVAPTGTVGHFQLIASAAKEFGQVARKRGRNILRDVGPFIQDQESYEAFLAKHLRD